MVALAIILGDALIFLIGIGIGIAGIGVEVALGSAAFSAFHHLF